MKIVISPTSFEDSAAEYKRLNDVVKAADAVLADLESAFKQANEAIEDFMAKYHSFATAYSTAENGVREPGFAQAKETIAEYRSQHPALAEALEVLAKRNKAYEDCKNAHRDRRRIELDVAYLAPLYVCERGHRLWTSDPLGRPLEEKSWAPASTIDPQTLQFPQVKRLKIRVTVYTYLCMFFSAASYGWLRGSQGAWIAAALSVLTIFVYRLGMTRARKLSMAMVSVTERVTGFHHRSLTELKECKRLAVAP